MQAILQYYFTVFYGTASNEIAIKFIKLRMQNFKLKYLEYTLYLEDINELVTMTP